MERVILHCDMNNYFASVEEKFNPALRKVPFAVCGDPEMRHSIVMAKNALAKQAGVITGISFHQAQALCPNLQYVRADYPKYLAETKQARQMYRKYTDVVIPYGLDEAWLDLTETGASMQDAQQIADLLRLEIKYSQGLSASVGVSDNLIFAKLGSDYKKPDATTVITKENYRQLVWPLAVSELLFVGEKRRRILSALGIRTIGQLAQAQPSLLTRKLGKVGSDLQRFANGDDRSFHPEQDTIASIGNTITPPEDICSEADAGAVLYLLVSAVCARLHKHGLKAQGVGVVMRDSRFRTLTRQCGISVASDDIGFLFNRVFALFRRSYTWELPLRSLGVRVDRICPAESGQLSFFDTDGCEPCLDMDASVKALTARFGALQVERSAAARDW